MARHTRLHWTPAAAVLILCAAFAWFSPRRTRDMLPLSAEGGDVRALTVSGDGTLRAFALPASGLLSSASPPPCPAPSPGTSVCPPAACVSGSPPAAPFSAPRTAIPAVIGSWAPAPRSIKRSRI